MKIMYLNENKKCQNNKLDIHLSLEASCSDV